MMNDIPSVESRILLLRLINNIAQVMEDKSILRDIKGIDKIFHQLLKAGNEQLSKEVLRMIKMFVEERQGDIAVNTLGNLSPTHENLYSSESTDIAGRLSDATIAERVLSKLVPWMGSWGWCWKSTNRC